MHTYCTENNIDLEAIKTYKYRRLQEIENERKSERESESPKRRRRMKKTETMKQKEHNTTELIEPHRPFRLSFASDATDCHSQLSVNNSLMPQHTNTDANVKDYDEGNNLWENGQCIFPDLEQNWKNPDGLHTSFEEALCDAQEICKNSDTNFFSENQVYDKSETNINNNQSDNTQNLLKYDEEFVYEEELQDYCSDDNEYSSNDLIDNYGNTYQPNEEEVLQDEYQTTRAYLQEYTHQIYSNQHNLLNEDEHQQTFVGKNTDQVQVNMQLMSNEYPQQRNFLQEDTDQFDANFQDFNEVQYAQPDTSASQENVVNQPIYFPLDTNGQQTSHFQMDQTVFTLD